MLKNNRSNPTGKQKARQIPCNILDPDHANIYIHMPSSFQLSRSALVPKIIGLLLCLLIDLNCNMDQGVKESCRKWLDLHSDTASG